MRTLRVGKSLLLLRDDEQVLDVSAYDTPGDSKWFGFVTPTDWEVEVQTTHRTDVTVYDTKEERDADIKRIVDEVESWYRDQTLKES